MIITIDGPVASGKSTAAFMLAKELGFYYLNSGLLYRALGYLLMQESHYTLEQLPLASKDDIDTYLDPQRIRYVCDQESMPHLFFDNHDITSLLKTEGMDKAASLISTNMYVREKLLTWQRHIAAHDDIVAEGRDSGTVVFPNAQVKFFLTAPVKIRAKRWQKDQEKKGSQFSLAVAQGIIEERDARDSNRLVAPLVIPEGAVVIDNGRMSLQETVQTMLTLVKPIIDTQKK